MRRLTGWLKNRSTQTQHRFQRIRLLNDEVVQVRQATVERTKSLETKLTSVGVTSGALATLTGVKLSQEWGTIQWWSFALSLLAIFICLVTMLTAAWGLRLRKLDVPDTRTLVNEWVDSSLTPGALEDALLEVRITEIKSRDKHNESKAKIMKWAFFMLITSFMTTVMSVVVSRIALL